MTLSADSASSSDFRLYAPCCPPPPARVVIRCIELSAPRLASALTTFVSGAMLCSSSSLTCRQRRQALCCCGAAQPFSRLGLDNASPLALLVVRFSIALGLLLLVGLFAAAGCRSPVRARA